MELKMVQLRFDRCEVRVAFSLFHKIDNAKRKTDIIWC